MKKLSARQTEVLNWISLGKTNEVIGEILGISPLTVKNTVATIIRKCGVENRAAAVGYALRNGMLS